MIRPLPAYPVYLILHCGSAIARGAAFSFFSLYLIVEVGLEPLELALVGTALELPYFFLEVPTGVVADRVSRRLSVVVGLALMGCGLGAMTLTRTFWPVVAVQIVIAAAFAFESGADVAWISDEIGQERAARAFLRAAQVAHVGTLVGIALGMAAATASLRGPLLVGAGVHVGLAGLLVVVMPEEGFRRGRVGRQPFRAMTRTFREGVRTVRRRRVLGTILLVAALYGLASEGIDRLGQLHLLRELHLPDAPFSPLAFWFGVLAAGQAVVGIVVAEVVRRRADLGTHRGVVQALLTVDVLLVVSMLVFAFAWNFLLGLGSLWAVYGFRSAHLPLMAAWVDRDLDSSVRATVHSMRGQADSMGEIAGGPLFGGIAALSSTRTALVGAGVALVPAFLLYRRAARSNPAEVRKFPAG